MRYDMKDVDFSSVEGLYYCRCVYHVFDEFNNLVSAICPFCFARQHLINILTPEPTECAEGASYCSICDRRFNVRTWEIPEEVKNTLEKERDKEKHERIVEAIAKGCSSH